MAHFFGDFVTFFAIGFDDFDFYFVRGVYGCPYCNAAATEYHNIADIYFFFFR